MNFKNAARVISLVLLITLTLLNGLCTVADNTTSTQAAAPSPAMTTTLPQSEAEALFESYFNGDQIFGKQDRHHRLKETYWTPTAADVAQAELALAGYMRIKIDTHVFPEPQSVDLTKYFRQYAGAMRGDKKCILINAFMVSEVSSMDALSGSHRSGERWHNHAVLICDGGPAFFHASYNPITHQIENVQFNGFL